MGGEWYIYKNTLSLWKSYRSFTTSISWVSKYCINLALFLYFWKKTFSKFWKQLCKNEQIMRKKLVFWLSDSEPIMYAKVQTIKICKLLKYWIVITYDIFQLIGQNWVSLCLFFPFFTLILWQFWYINEKYENMNMWEILFLTTYATLFIATERLSLLNMFNHVSINLSHTFCNYKMWVFFQVGNRGEEQHTSTAYV